MEQQQQRRKRSFVKRGAWGARPAPVVSLEESTFSPAAAKEKDFDLDLDAMKYQGKKGQAGTRSKMVS